MPTGYTADIVDGKPVTFQEFAMRCARAFIPEPELRELRDSPLNTPIPKESRPSTYYTDSIKREEAELARLRAMTPDQQTEFGKREILADAARRWRATSIAHYRDMQARDGGKRKRLQSMLEKARAWTPPTKDHQGLKDFMVRQIVETINFDCGGEYEEDILRLESKPALAFWTDAVEGAARSLEYLKKHQSEDIQRAAERTKWVKDLRASLEVK